MLNKMNVHITNFSGIEASSAALWDEGLVKCGGLDMGWEQVLDSGGSGRLSSADFCAAIKNLVFFLSSFQNCFSELP